MAVFESDGDGLYEFAFTESPHRSRWSQEKYSAVGKHQWPVGSQSRKRERFAEKNQKFRGFDPETTSLLMKEFPDHHNAGNPHKQDDSDTSVGSGGRDVTPSGPIARSLFQAVKQRARRALPGNGRSCAGSDNSSVNGHVELSELIATVKNSTVLTAQQSPRTPLHRRHRQRMKIELSKAPVAASSSRSTAATTGRTTSYHQLDSQPTPHQPSTAAVVADSGGGTRSDNNNDEHQLIAFCSALLQVSPLDMPPQPSSKLTHFAPTEHNLCSDVASVDSQAMHSNAAATQGNSSTRSTVVATVEYPKQAPPTVNCTDPHPDMPEPLPSTSTSGGSQPNSSYRHSLVHSPILDMFQRVRNRVCTSFRIQLSVLKNPVDICLLPNDYVAIADYDNGFVVYNALGDVVEHRHSANECNACGVVCSQPDARLYVLVFKDGLWAINVYEHCSHLVDTIRCPTDPSIESWALRKITMSQDTDIHLMASGEVAVAIWAYELPKHQEIAINGHDLAAETISAASGSVSTSTGAASSQLSDAGISVAPPETAASIPVTQVSVVPLALTPPSTPWKLLTMENSRKGGYNDLSVKFNPETKETTLLLCDLRKSMLSTIVLDEKLETADHRSIRVKRSKGQEWIVQGPNLAVLDEQSDIVVYDGSGKLFLFDGDTYRCKKIIADIGRGEVSAICARQGWVYVLCRYRLTLEVYMYKDFTETMV